MKPSIAVPLWDWVLVGAIFFPVAGLGVVFSGRFTAAAIYATAWMALAGCGVTVGRLQRLPFRVYLRAVLAPDVTR